VAVSHSNLTTESARIFLEGLSSVPDDWRQIVDYRNDDVAALTLAALSGVRDPGVWTNTGDLPTPASLDSSHPDKKGQPNGPGLKKTMSYTSYGVQIPLDKYTTKDVPQIASYTSQKLGMAVAHKYRALAFSKLADTTDPFDTEIDGIGGDTTTKVISTAHEMADGTNTRSNMLSGQSLSSTSLMKALQLMRKWQNWQGQYMSLFDGVNYLVVPPELEELAIQATQSTYTSEALQVNVAGMMNLKVVVSPFLTDANDWYIFSGQESPLKFWERSSPMFSIDLDQDSRQTKISVDFAVAVDWGVTPDGIFGSQV